FQRMAAEDFVAQVFPDQLACLENISGPREVPAHPLVQQTIHDCLTEAMDVEELEALTRRIAAAELQLVARDLREPSPFAQEIINARPYAFLDDAPFEERRTRAIRHRSWVDPAETGDFSALDQGAIDRVREEAWPTIRNADELHEALYLLGFMTDAEVHGSDSQPDVSIHLEPLIKAARVSCASRGRQRLWIAAERQPLFAALGLWAFRPEVQLPEALRVEQWDATSALRELLRGRLEALGPVTAPVLAASLGMEAREVLPALLQLEAEGFVFQGHYSPTGATGEKEWCERRLLQRIHRHTIDAHRENIKPVSLQVYMQHLFEHHGIRPADGSAAPVPGGPEVLARVLSLLEGCTVPAQAWETDILPARLERYDPAWLDQLCVRGQVCWGRILKQRDETAGRRSGPVRSSPMNLVRRDNLDLWQALAGGSGEEQRAGLSSAALLLLDLLRQRGASFHADLVRHSGLMALQVEEALAELVSAGLVTADNFSGLRALLLPAARRSRSRPHGRRPLFGIEDAGRWALLDASDSGPIPLDESRLDRLLLVYLQRWGVLCRKVMEREGTAPPWRVLLPRLRRMELRGEVRGGHFIAGVGGEQFALAGTVDALRARQRQWQQERDSGAARRPQRVVINATDPLNLLGILLPERRVAQLAGNRILFEDGLPVAVLEREELFCLGTATGSLAQEYRQLLGRQPGAL